MSTFEVAVVSVNKVEPIPNADKIEVAYIEAGYKSIVPKGVFKEGSTGIYIPEASIVPVELLRKLGLEGALSGPQKNRVKAKKLKGIVSQGILITNEDNDPVGTNLAEHLGIIKWEPEIPTHLAGEVKRISVHDPNRYVHDTAFTVKYDIENYKKYGDVFFGDEFVYITEKVHGTFIGMGVIPELNDPDLVDTNGIIYSKGLGGQGLVFKDNEANKNNLYLKVAKKYGIIQNIKHHFPYTSMYLFGEVYGKGVQDMTYFTQEPQLIIFDAYNLKQHRFYGYDDFMDILSILGLTKLAAPVLYKGMYKDINIYELTSGPSTLTKEPHIREGIVIKPFHERTEDKLGRVILKSVSEDYLFRKGNTTEYN